MTGTYCLSCLEPLTSLNPTQTKQWYHRYKLGMGCVFTACFSTKAGLFAFPEGKEIMHIKQYEASKKEQKYWKKLLSGV